MEVCSPGAEHELTTDEQIQAAIGSYVYAKLKDPKQGVDHVLGDLVSADTDSIVIAYNVKGRKKKIEIERSNLAMIMTAVKV